VTTVSLHANPTRSFTWFGNVVIVVFLVSQALDGIFTYLGISAFGLSEGNPLIAMSFRHAGVGPALTIAKLLAVGCSMLLHLFELHRTLAILTVLVPVARRPALELPDLHRATLNAPAASARQPDRARPEDADAAHRAHDHYRLLQSDERRGTVSTASDVPR
jgi:hypothetical protein